MFYHIIQLLVSMVTMVKLDKFGKIFIPKEIREKMGATEFEVVFESDHVELIQKTAGLLEPGGTLFFSTNFRRFKLDSERLKNLNVEDITAQTIPRDFERNRKIHQCWKISAEK